MPFSSLCSSLIPRPVTTVISLSITLNLRAHCLQAHTLSCWLIGLLKETGLLKKVVRGPLKERLIKWRSFSTFDFKVLRWHNYLEAFLELHDASHIHNWDKQNWNKSKLLVIAVHESSLLQLWNAFVKTPVHIARCSEVCHCIVVVRGTGQLPLSLQLVCNIAG